MSLYRKYRPQNFSQVIGQDHIVTTLENAAEQNKLSHAYLFSGARGTGKTSVARILAKVLLTRGIEDDTLRKQLEKGVEEGTIVDLIEIDAASNRGIDDIRMLVEKIQFSPVVGSAKVYIIDEVHMLTKEAFNALLKTLEEPPPYAYFILATTELQKIPATIQSRCQRFVFRTIREEDIIRGLQGIADQEKIEVDRAALRAIAYHAAGSLRDAISLLDQLRSLEKISVEDVKERTGEAMHEHVEAILDALEKSDRAQLIEIVRKIEEAGVPLDILVRHLLTEIRRHLHGAIEEKQPIARLTHMLDILLHAVRDIRIAPVPGLVLESALLSLTETEAEERSSWLFTRKKKEEPAPAEAATDVTQPRKTAAPAKAAKQALVEAPEVTLEAVREMWPAILRETQPASVRMSLKNGRVHSVRGNSVVVGFMSAFHRDKVAELKASRAIEETLENLFKTSLKLECILEEEGESRPLPDESMVNLAEAAAEVF
jgi:DNA polymerase-3 subunit gamma/tau